MASAVLASGNETSWMKSGRGRGRSSGIIGKIPYFNTKLNPISNPKKKQKHFHHTSNVVGRENSFGEFPSIKSTSSDDEHSFVQKPVEFNRINCFNSGGYLTYNISTYSKPELLQLRERFVYELEQVRIMRDRIESVNLISSGPPRSFNKASDILPNGFDNRGMENIDCVMDESMMKECRQILTKLLRQKFGYIFKAPVDAAALGLHDYHQIIKRPMDLGTVKLNLSRNLYPSPMDFAADVRLTFNNAMLYNPKTNVYHGYAEMLLGRFEELFRPIQEKIDMYTREKINLYAREYMGGDGGLVEEVQRNSWNHIQAREKIREQKASPISRKHGSMQSRSSASTPSTTPRPIVQPIAQSPVPIVSPVKPHDVSQVLGRVKLPKPRPNDPNKREMSMEEKIELGEELQNLPQEKMDQLVKIINKNYQHFVEAGEIELDMQVLDTETLWELDWFVADWMLSITERQAVMVNSSNPATAVDTSASEVDQGPVNESDIFALNSEKGEIGDEDVDIGDDMPATSFPPVEIEKDAVVGPDNGTNASSSSSSSSSDSSSSSGNGSGLTEVSFSTH